MISSEVRIVLALDNGLCTQRLTDSACDIRPRHAQRKTLIGLSSLPPDHNLAVKTDGLFFGPSGGFLLKKFREAVGRDCTAGEASKASNGV
jgi:hypothetical protein